MMKNLLLIGFIFILLLLGSQAQAQVQVGYGTNTSQKVPIYAYYGYTYSQQIYFASEINTPSGTITHLKFYFNGSHLSASNDWKIYIGTTSKNSFSSNTDWVSTSSMIMVYDSIFNDPATSGWLTFDITDWAYDGISNIIVAIDENSPNYNNASDMFYSSDVSNNRSMCYYNDNTNPDPSSPPAANFGPVAFIPNIIFSGITQSCPPPSNLAATNTTATTATLVWTTGGSTNFNIEYGLAGFTQGTGTMVSNSSNSYPLTGLTTATAYDFYVQDSCGVDDVSLWMMSSFITQALLIDTFLFTEDFSNGSSHWALASASNSGAAIDTNAGNPGSGLILTGGTSTSWSNYATVIGAFNNATHVSSATGTVDATSLTNVRFEFDMRQSYTYNATYGWARVMINGTDYAKDLNGDSVWQANTANADPFQSLAFDLSAYAGTIFNISIELAAKYNASNYNNTYGDDLYIDNISIYQPAPNDLKAYSLSKLNSGFEMTNSMDVGVKIYNNGTVSQNGYTISYSIDNGSTFTTQTIATTIAAGDYATHTFTSTADLSTLGVYNLVLAVANTGDTSSFNDTIYASVKNRTMPYTDDFEAYNNLAIPTDWKTINTTGVAGAYASTSNSNSHSGSRTLRLYNAAATSGDLISVFPAVYSGLTNKAIKFWVKGSASVDLIVGALSDPNDASTFVAIDTIIVPNNYTQVAIYFSSYTGTGNYIGFKHGLNGTNNSIYIDDIELYEPIPYDLSILSIGGITSEIEMGPKNISVSVYNNGSTTQSGYNVSYSVDGGSTYTTEVINTSINPGDTVDYTFTASATLAPGTINIIAVANNTADGNNANDTAYLSKSNFAIPYITGFENDQANEIPEGWNTLNNTGNNNVFIEIYNNTGYANTGLHSLRIYNHSSTINDVMAVMPKDNTTNGVSAKVLKFWAKGDSNYELIIGVMTGDTATASFVGIDTISPPFTYTFFTIDLSSYTGTGTYIAFKHGMSNTGQLIYIDDIELYEPIQNDIEATSIELESATNCESTLFSFDAIFNNNGIATQNNVPVTAVITNPNGVVTTLTATTGSMAKTINDTVTFSSVDVSVYGNYSVQIYSSLIGEEDTSNDTLTTTFELLAPFALDHVEDFEDGGVNWLNTGMSVGANGHGKSGKGLYKNFYSTLSAQHGSAIMKNKIGSITANSKFVFDYQIKNYSGGLATVLLGDDKFYYMLSTDCGTTFDTIVTIDSTNHTATLDWTHKMIDLTSYIGQEVIIKFSGIWKAGDYYFNMDNIGISTPIDYELGNDTTVCDNENLVIGMDYVSGYTYMWTTDGDTIAYTGAQLAIDSAATYTVEVTSPLGMAYDTLTVTMNTTTTCSFTGLASMYCNNEATVTLVGLPTGGVFTGTGINGIDFNPAIADLGSQTITYTYINNNLCSNSDSFSTIINAAPLVSFTGLDTLYCENYSSDTLISTPSGGIFSGLGITDSIFSPNSLSGNISVYYTYTDINGCSNIDTATTTIIGTPTNFSGLKPNYILSNSVDTLIGNPVGGVFSGPGMNGSIFDFISIGVGTYDITYTYTDTNNCTNSSTNSTIVNNYISPINLSSSANVYGYLVEQCTPLTANEDIDVIHYTHRANPAVMGSSSGDIISSQSRDGGSTWTHLMAYPNATGYNNRYPGGVIYNPVGNTDADSAYIITFGPSHDGVWKNSFMGSMRLDSTHIDHQYMPTYGAIVRRGLQATSNGRFHIIATNHSGSRVDTIRLIEGIWDNTNNKVNWSESKFQASFVVINGSSKVLTEFNTAWSEDGSIGYYWTMGRDTSNDLRSYQPIVWKSINSGSTWTKMPIFDFGSLTNITDYLKPMKGVSPAISRPIFSSSNDGTVDANGELHIVAKIKAALSNHNDSLARTYTFANSSRSNPIFDIYSSATGWNAIHLGDVATEDVSLSQSGYGAGWELRLQASRTTDGTKVFASWAESDTNNTAIYYNGGIPINKYPNIIATGFDVVNLKRTLQKNFTIGTTISNACHFHSMSDITLSDLGVYTIPMTKLNIGSSASQPVFIKYIKGIQFKDSDFIDNINFPTENYDLKITNISTPTICEDSQIVSATLINMGRIPLSTANIGVSVNGINKNDQAWSGFELNYNDSVIIVLDNSFKPASNTTNTIRLYIKTINGNSDNDNSNDTAILNKYYYALPVISYTNPLKSSYCINGLVDTLSATPYGGTYTGIGLQDSIFNPSLIGIDSCFITYTYFDANGCVNSDTKKSYVYGIPTVSLSGLNTSFCTNDEEDTLVGLPSGGNYSGIGITANVFNPSTAGAGFFDIVYSYTDANNCTNTETSSTTVHTSPTIQFTSLDTTYCNNGIDDTLTATPIGGSFSGMGITANIFSPSTTGAGNFDIIYSFTDANSCSNSDTSSTIVNALPAIQFTSLDTTYCNNSIDDTLSASPTGGSFSGTGITANVFSPSTTGVGNYDIIYSITDTNSCSNSDTASTIVNALPSVQLTGLGSVYCSNSGDIQLNGIPTGGSFSGAGISGSTFNTMSAGTGNHNIIYSFTDINGCSNSDTSNTLVNDIPNINLGADQSVCINHTITLDAGAGFASYLWNTGATTQTITLDSLIFNIGNNNYSVEVTNSDNCNNADTITLIVDPCTSILTPELSNTDMNVFPNPTKGKFQIELIGLENKSYDLEIYSSIGDKIYSKKVDFRGEDKLSYNIDLSAFSKGIYFIRLQSEGKIKVKKIVIQ